MSIVRSLEAIRRSEGPGLVDWTAAATAAKEATPRGSIDESPGEYDAYRDGFIEAREAISTTIGRSVTLPDRIELFDRHHWIDHTATGFDRIVDPVLGDLPQAALARSVNTGTAAFTLGYLGRRVVGQYDPALFGAPAERGLYIVDPNLRRTADELAVSVDPFRRWVTHHEVSHAAEFDLAPWLVDHLETRIEVTLEAVANGTFDRSAIGELTDTMTVVEGFAELLMDEAIDEDVEDLRGRLERKRAGLGPLSQLIEWILGITAKRQQYDRGRAFFRTIADEAGIEATLLVWADPHNLPSRAELADPIEWLDRVGPDGYPA